MTRIRHTRVMSPQCAFSHRGTSSSNQPSRVSHGESPPSSHIPIFSYYGFIDEEGPTGLNWYPLEEASMETFVDGHPLVDLQWVTCWTLIYFSKNKDYPTVSDGSVVPLPFQIGDGVDVFAKRVRVAGIIPLFSAFEISILNWLNICPVQLVNNTWIRIRGLQEVVLANFDDIDLALFPKIWDRLRSNLRRRSKRRKKKERLILGPKDGVSSSTSASHLAARGTREEVRRGILPEGPRGLSGMKEEPVEPTSLIQSPPSLRLAKRRMMVDTA
ncbi:uncharacterized protein G2W53_003648 [Senna tora]|uniref:Uncharacterized protein n=1 Tax=Senna tora TaxID=362788 RepID=A0A835CIL7_9FABA|nr:uncharacterized protein G2W53_003648 [Senna tora]